MPRRIDIDAERIFENGKVDGNNPRANQQKFYWATELGSEDFRTRTFERIRGKKVLEIGCSDGEMTEKYARFCKSITGVDLSDSGIRKAELRNLPNASFKVCDAHRLPFDDGSFDAVIVNGVLHHLDLEIALREIRRVLAQGGVLCAQEPLGINPAFSLYRMLTPGSRTEDERPFTFSDLRLLYGTFPGKDETHVGFLVIASAFLVSARLRKWLNDVDRLLSRTPLKYLYWQFYGFYTK